MSLAEKLAVLLPALLVAGVLALTTHEVGHFISGSLERLRVFVFCAGPIRVARRADGRLHISWVRSFSEACGMAGMALDGSRDEQGIRRALILFAIGGPIASLVFGGALLVAFLALGLAELTWERDGMTKAVAGGVLVYALSSLGLRDGLPQPVCWVCVRWGARARDAARWPHRRP